MPESIPITDDTRRTLLIAEDDRDLQNVLRVMVERLGYAVAVVNDGIEAMNYLESHSADAVLSDICMPKMDGLELLLAVRGKHGDLPFVLLTSVEERQSVVEALRLGATDFINKPIDVELLSLVISRVLEIGVRKKKLRKSIPLTLSEKMLSLLQIVSSQRRKQPKNDR